MQPKCEYFWNKIKDGYQLVKGDSGELIAYLIDTKEGVKMAFHWDGKVYKGFRPKWDEAFITLDRLIYQKAKDVWLRSDCHVVLERWQGDLNME
jgi:hypothetical protein